MALGETNIGKRIQKKLSALGSRLFRNNRGLFLTLDGTRKVRAGIEMDGSSDLIGYTKVEITPEMVGKKIAVITVCEVKSLKGRVQDNQQLFINAIRAAGGFGFVARSEDEADYQLKQQIGLLKR